MSRKSKRTIGQRQFIEEQSETLQELFEIFIRAKETEGLRPRSLEDHRYNFRYFMEYLQEHESDVHHGKDVKTVTIRNYIYFMSKEKGKWDTHKQLAKFYSHQKGLSPVTINVRLRSLKCFFKFLFDEKHLPENPAEKIKLLKTEKDTIGAFSKEQLDLLLKQPNQRSYAGFRDYVLMVLFLDTGVRCKEALSLTTKEFSYENKSILIKAERAKNHQARILPLSKETAKLIQTLIKENNAFDSTCDRIFMSYYGESLNPAGLRERFKEYGNQANIKGVRVSPHTFRHTFAKFYILNGGDPFTLQRLLDHSTMNMVRKYIQMNSEDIQLQHNQFSPLKNINIK